MTIAQAFNEITIAQGGTPSTGGTITGAIDALNDTLAGSDQKPAQTIEGAIRLLGAHIGGGGGGSDFTTAKLTVVNSANKSPITFAPIYIDGVLKISFFPYIGETQTYDIVIGKNGSDIWLPYEDVIGTVTGAAVSAGEGHYTVTGDVTITITTA